MQYGYESTTMAKIANMAQISQGAMQYHFGAKIEAIKAAINYLHAKRLIDHEGALEDVPKGVDPMVHIVDFYWQQLNQDYFVAYQELVIAARNPCRFGIRIRPGLQEFCAPMAS